MALALSGRLAHGDDLPAQLAQAEQGRGQRLVGEHPTRTPPAFSLRRLAQDGVKPPVLHAPAPRHIAVPQLIPVAVAQPVFALGAAEHPRLPTFQAVVLGGKHAAIPRQQRLLLPEDARQLRLRRLRRLRPTLAGKLPLPQQQLLLRGQLPQTADHLRADAGGVKGVVAGVVKFPLGGQSQRLHRVLQGGLLIGAQNHQVEGALQIVDLQGEVFLHPVPDQIRVQHPGVAGTPGEEGGAVAAPVEKAGDNLREPLRPEQLLLIQRQHFAHPMVELAVNGRTNIGGEHLALCLPVFQPNGAQLDDLVQLVRLTAGISLIPFQIKKYIAHTVTLQQFKPFVNGSAPFGRKKEILKIAVDKQTRFLYNSSCPVEGRVRRHSSVG